MMAEALPLSIKFQSDLENICRNLVSIFGLRFTQELENLSDPVMRWIDFRLRYVDPKPRRVVCSDTVLGECPRVAIGGLQNLISLFEAGEDVNPYQGKGLTEFHDISRKKRGKRTDLLWADWGILHFHVTSEAPPEIGYAPRSDWLLFVLLKSDEVGLIAVRPHATKYFSDPQLLEIVARNWPDYIAQYELNGMLPGDEQFSASEYAELRACGITPHLTINGKSYLGPGLGITSASTPIRVTHNVGIVRRYVRALAEWVLSTDSPFIAEATKRGAANPSFSLSLTPRGIAVYEETHDIAFLLCGVERDKWSGEFHDLIAPPWVLAALNEAAR